MTTVAPSRAAAAASAITRARVLLCERRRVLVGIDALHEAIERNRLRDVVAVDSAIRGQSARLIAGVDPFLARRAGTSTDAEDLSDLLFLAQRRVLNEMCRLRARIDDGTVRARLAVTSGRRRPAANHTNSGDGARRPRRRLLRDRYEWWLATEMGIRAADQHPTGWGMASETGAQVDRTVSHSGSGGWATGSLVGLSP